MTTKLLGRLIDGTSVAIKRGEIASLSNGDSRRSFSFDVDGMMVGIDVDLPERQAGYRHFLEMGELAKHGFASIEPA